MMNRLIFISGVSGVGKSTLVSGLATKLQCSIIHQDSYFVAHKPRVTLSDGTKVSDWDCLEAIDFETLVAVIRTSRGANKLTIVEGFCLPNDLIGNSDLHLHLSPIYLSLEDKPSKRFEEQRSVIIDRIEKARLKTKSGSEHERLKIEELVWPFYLETLERSTIDFFINVYNDDGTRRSESEIVSEVMTIIVG